MDRFRRIRKELPAIDSDIPVCVGNWGKRCCSWWHIPPRFMRDWRPYFLAPTRFCAVRNPYARVLSEYSFGHGKEMRKLTCDQLNRTDVNLWLRAQMARYAGGETTLNDCHWIPQHVYIETGRGVDGSSASDVRFSLPTTDKAGRAGDCNRVSLLLLNCSA
jgi:hypothetical protein